MERREQVFVSSTYVDLREERQEVIQTLLEADCIPAGMELFPASDDDRWTLIKREIERSDYYVVLIGGRYGSVDEEAGLSYTEMEFDYADSVGIPIMGFLHGEPGKIEQDKTELDPERRAALETFRKKVETRIVKYWTSPKELGGQVAKSLIRTRQTHPAEGWVRARDAITPELDAELRELRSRVRELEAELRERQQSSTIATVTDLSHGEESTPIAYRLSYWTEQQMTEPSTYRRGNAQQISAYISVSWNELLAVIGPELLVESSARKIEEALRAYIIKRMDLPSDYGSGQRFEVHSESMRKIFVQFSALGLIQPSTRRHAPSDTGEYWSLTPEGNSQVIRLSAIRTATQGATGANGVPDTRASTAKSVPRRPPNKEGTKRAAKKPSARK